MNYTRRIIRRYGRFSSRGATDPIGLAPELHDSAPAWFARPRNVLHQADLNLRLRKPWTAARETQALTPSRCRTANAKHWPLTGAISDDRCVATRNWAARRHFHEAAGQRAFTLVLGAPPRLQARLMAPAHAGVLSRKSRSLVEHPRSLHHKSKLVCGMYINQQRSLDGCAPISRPSVRLATLTIARQGAGTATASWAVRHGVATGLTEPTTWRHGACRHRRSQGTDPGSVAWMQDHAVHRSRRRCSPFNPRLRLQPAGEASGWRARNRWTEPIGAAQREATCVTGSRCIQRYPPCSASRQKSSSLPPRRLPHFGNCSPSAAGIA